MAWGVALIRFAANGCGIEIQAGLRTPHLAAPTARVRAYAATTRAAVGIIGELNTAIAQLEHDLADHFEQHPDADIYLSVLGLGDVLGAPVLGEFGDAPNRYASAKHRKNYAGTSPLTIASGRKRAVLARHVPNKRLYDAIDQWAFCALTASPGARAFYDHRRASGDLHHQPRRHAARAASPPRYNEHKPGGAIRRGTSRSRTWPVPEGPSRPRRRPRGLRKESQ